MEHGGTAEPSDEHSDSGYSIIDSSLFYVVLPAAILLNDGSLKGDSLKLGHLQGNIPGSGVKVAAIVAAAIDLVLLSALIPGCLVQLICFGLQQLVVCFTLPRTSSLSWPSITFLA